MKLLHCISSVNPAAGGPSEALRQRLQSLGERGHYSEVACLDDPTASFLVDFPVPVHALGPGRGTYSYSSAWIPWVKSNHRRFDAIIINGLWQFHGYGTRLAIGRDFPYFVFPHGMLDPWFKRTYPLKHLKKWLYWPWAEYRVLRDARAVLFTSEEERRLARESFWLYRCREIVVNYGTAGPTGDPTEHQDSFQAAFPALRGKHFLLYLGRLHEKKGVDLLCHAWAHLQSDVSDQRMGDVQLVIAGPGESSYVDAIRALIDRLNLTGSVQLTGMLTGATKWGALAAAEAFILPSHQENFGLAVTEALACGTPVLISNRVNIWREIAAEGAGIVEPDDLPGTIRLLQRWHAASSSEKATMSVRARESFGRRFQIERAVDSLISAVQSQA